MSQDFLTPADFDGTARLFPLPNLVLFPHVAQPLHIFEPRYRALMEDALDDNRLMALALLEPDWEEDYHKKPPIYPMTCLGRVMQEQRLPDGRFNFVLHGICRARVREELRTNSPYRTARVELCHDEPIGSPARERTIRRQLGEGVMPFFSNHPPAREQLQRLLSSAMPLGALSDIFCFALPLPIEIKQQLLDEVGVETRIRLLLHSLDGCSPPAAAEAGTRRKFPPEFSEN